MQMTCLLHSWANRGPMVPAVDLDVVRGCVQGKSSDCVGPESMKNSST